MSERIENKAPISKINEAKRIVYGVVYAPNDPDADDNFMTRETVEDMAHRWMIASQKIDRDHSNVPIDAMPVESFIARAGDPDFPEGAWVLATKVLNDDLWAQVKTGVIKSYSLAGTAEPGDVLEMDSRWYDESGNRIDPFVDGAA